MSIDALSWAFNLDMPTPASKLTLLALANYANENGIAFPSYNTLSRKTSMSTRSLQSNIKLLEKMGLLVKTLRTRPNGSKTSTLYHLQVGNVPNLTAKSSPPMEAASIPPMEGASIPHRKQLPNPMEGASIPDPSLNTTKEKIRKGGTAGFSLPNFIQAEIWDAFEEMRCSELRKPMTLNTANVIVKLLDRLRQEGHDPNRVLEQSIANGWAGVFHLRKEWKERFNPVAYVNRHRGMEGRTFEH